MGHKKTVKKRGYLKNERTRVTDNGLQSNLIIHNACLRVFLSIPHTLKALNIYLTIFMNYIIFNELVETNRMMISYKGVLICT